MSAKTIHETTDGLSNALVEYIEATYHIANPQLLKQRRLLLDKLGIIKQAPYLESTPRYHPGDSFANIEGLSAEALAVFQLLSKPRDDGKVLLFDPPYKHQSDAISASIVRKNNAYKNLVIMTGTGSGKTESFLMPILGKLAEEANSPSGSFAQSAMRAMILYPMNALVNDQLGRLRSIFGDPRLVAMFKGWSNRPPRFARYTSRTPYAGLRVADKDQRNLKQFRDFYVGALEDAASDEPSIREPAARLIEELHSRGKWPAKPDLAAWYGRDGTRWQDASKNFIRAITLPDDSEMVTRHESQASAPDLMVTNYSMLEYMLMRPVEKTIFDQTRTWLDKNPDERFMVVLDEAHLYRGAGGAEVGLLLRRLRDRLQISVDRFQVICATASFSDPVMAKTFASQLTGTPESSFEIIEGKQLTKSDARTGTDDEASLFANLDMDGFNSPVPEQREKSVAPVIAYCGGTVESENTEQKLFRALGGFGPLSLLINTTMKKAQPLAELGQLIFPGTPSDKADLAVTNLAALATSARMTTDSPSLIPCRVHSFFRGLRGLWACTDANCTEIDSELRGVVGKLYTQPIDICGCNARVLELFTCRLCGSAYFRGYCANPDEPTTVWNEPGAELRSVGHIAEQLQPLDIMIAKPTDEKLADPAIYDLVFGTINPKIRSGKTREIYLPRQQEKTTTASDDDEDNSAVLRPEPGIFNKCGACCKGGNAGVSPVQDHETKGDQPFQVLVSRQLQVQPPNAQAETKFAPLRGRKVLVFSDSRQVAARLAPNLQMFAARDSLRPLIAFGWRRLSEVPSLPLRIEDIFCAAVIAAHKLGVRLRPELSQNEHFSDYESVGQVISGGGFDSDDEIKDVCNQLRSGDGPPESLLVDMMTTIRDPLLGLEALALASIIERSDKRANILGLPHIPGVTETEDDKIQLARAWLRQWKHTGFWLRSMGDHWYKAHINKKVRVSSLAGTFQKFIGRLPTPNAKKVFKDRWLPELLQTFARKVERQHRLDGLFLSLEFCGSWVRCEDCKSVHRPLRLLPVCQDCGRTNVRALDPENDEVFVKRKRYYRQGVTEVLSGNQTPPMAIIAAEHTAQLNSAQKEDVFSKAEINELLFQDVELPPDGGSVGYTAVDVLSSTTTMEVGIDIGQLSGVALRNMPPSRANYQQRAGRAGRRASAIATVIAFGGSDTHDEHFFSRPADMITGEVIDPKLSLNNADIARRHLRAFLLQCYLEARVLSPTHADPNLFSVLGSVTNFLKSNQALNRKDFEKWLNESAEMLRIRADQWLPLELDPSARQKLLDEMIEDSLASIDSAIDVDPEPAANSSSDAEDESTGPEVQAEVGDARPPTSPTNTNLLDTLLYKGVLPRYAFPTDVSTFHVFDSGRSTSYRPVLEFAPSQGASVALSQYAPGKQVWIAGKCYTSEAIYSPVAKDRRTQWEARKLQLECTQCGYTCLERFGGDIEPQDTENCRACNGENTLGPARLWFRPSGFAHPQEKQALLSPEEIPETSYATRAKLIMESQNALNSTPVTDWIQFCTAHTHLLVSNTGPAKRGYSYCIKCGRIEASTATSSALTGQHPKPYPDPRKQICPGGGIAREVVLGTDFITDVALFSFRLDTPIRLRPADSITHVAMRTLCEALSRAATDLLQIEAGEVMAEFRPAITEAGCRGQQAEIFLYDTLPGGAGFAQDAASKGQELFAAARKLMEECAEGCTMSCYRCLRSFRNRLDHGLLDRHTGIALVDYLTSGTLKEFNAERLAASTSLLHADLIRQDSLKVTRVDSEVFVDDLGHRHVSPLHVINAQGRPFLIVVVSPLKETNPPRVIADTKGNVTLIEVNELIVRRNLAEATHQVRSRLGAV